MTYIITYVTATIIQVNVIYPAIHKNEHLDIINNIQVDISAIFYNVLPTNPDNFYSIFHQPIDIHVVVA